MQAQEYFSALYQGAVQPILVVDRALKPIYQNIAFSEFSDVAGISDLDSLFAEDLKEQAERCMAQMQGATVLRNLLFGTVSFMLLPSPFGEEIYLAIHPHRESVSLSREDTLRIFRNSYDRMRTYLNEIYGIAQVLGKESPEGKLIGESVRRLLRMANHLYLALDREGQMKYRVPLNLNTFLKSYLEGFQRVSNRHVSYVPRMKELFVRMMPEDFELVLGTLLSNAFRFGGEEVLLSISSTQETVKLCVWDSGTGVEDEEHLFEWGYRTADKKGRKGLGYSLPLAKLLLEQQGATLRYCPKEEGCAFEIEMKREELPAATLAQWSMEPLEDGMSQLRIELSDLG